MNRQLPFEPQHMLRGETVMSFDERPAGLRGMRSYQERRRD